MELNGPSSSGAHGVVGGQTVQCSLISVMAEEIPWSSGDTVEGHVPSLTESGDTSWSFPQAFELDFKRQEVENVHPHKTLHTNVYSSCTDHC